VLKPQAGKREMAIMKHVIPDHAEEPTWQEKVETQIKETEVRLRSLREYDKVLEVLMVGSGGGAPA